MALEDLSGDYGFSDFFAGGGSTPQYSFLDTIPTTTPQYPSFNTPAMASAKDYLSVDPSLYYSNYGMPSNAPPEQKDLLSQLGNYLTSKQGLALGGSLLGSAAGYGLGQLAGSQTEKQIGKLNRPSANTQALQNAATQSALQPRDLASILAEYQSILGPGIQEQLRQERSRNLGSTEAAIGLGGQSGSALAQIISENQARTNNTISQAIANAVQAERTARVNQLANALSTAQSGDLQRTGYGVQGVQLGQQAAGQASGAVTNALLTAALLGSKGGLLGA